MAKLFVDLWWFGLKQAWACMFGGLLLLGILLSHFFWLDDALLPRYDFLFIYAVVIQASFLFLKLETWEEAKVILIFHIVGTVMELFKTHVGSWSYPEENYIRLYGVPLFSGFMYSAVGSFLARVWREFDFRYKNYPPFWQTLAVGMGVYVNFFSHHYVWDFRYILMLSVVLMFRSTWIYFSVRATRYRMPVLLAIFLGAFFIWFAENIATYSNIWLYPNQIDGWQMVPVSKFGSWFLLMIISGVLLTTIQKPMEENCKG
ncbi:DUF817 domain-containing protein [Kordiimonas laminariae]|uniref:DUF817 domain-containing protein n=1 Tax=Kordiimonas laminariae TaxID=2917717 RepID=UPI001FF56AE3|nr:DUF817 domain-containing protein [Kordiimonas laminariae]MCK0068767.1 DUF817 domain-containing protein [Kordiimonas laminariae]